MKKINGHLYITLIHKLIERIKNIQNIQKVNKYRAQKLYECMEN